MDVDAWRLRAQTAMHEQGTLLEIARIILAFADDMDDLTREICREIVERHKYDHCAIFLSHVESHSPRLAHGARLGDNLTEPEAEAFASEAIAHSQALTARSGDSWRVAIPIEDGSTTLGAMIAGSVGSDADSRSALALCRALTRLIAIGIQNATLRMLELELATRQEYGRIPSEFHDE